MNVPHPLLLGDVVEESSPLRNVAVTNKSVRRSTAWPQNGHIAPATRTAPLSEGPFSLISWAFLGAGDRTRTGDILLERAGSSMGGSRVSVPHGARAIKIEGESARRSRTDRLERLMARN
jgi:hypothetical protein